jgi:hypothetical protein
VDQFNSNSGNFWDRYRSDPKYADCRGLIDRHEQMSRDLAQLDEQARHSVEPRETELVRQVNELARQRNEVQQRLFACIRMVAQAKPGSPLPGQATWQSPLPDTFSSRGTPDHGRRPAKGVFNVPGSPAPPPNNPSPDVFSSDACRKNPQSYTCKYGHPNDPSIVGPARPPPIDPSHDVFSSNTDPAWQRGRGKPDAECHDPPQVEGRFRMADMNEADPNLLVTAKILEGWDECEKEKFGTSLMMVPVNFFLGKARMLKTLVVAYGYTSTVGNLINDISALREPGQTLGQVAHQVGRLLCYGYDLNDILSKRAFKELIQRTKKKPAREEHPRPKEESQLSRNGISEIDDVALRKFVMAHKVILILRDSNPDSLRWVGAPNAVPKPMALKAKTLRPPDDPARLTTTERLEEKYYEPYYGLASARGLSAKARQEILDAGFLIQPKCNGEVITTRSGQYIYADIDVHGIYGLDGTWAGSNAALKTLNGTTIERFFQHGAQDDFFHRNDPTNKMYGPQPPVTIYLPGQVIHLATMEEMRAFYVAHNINWDAIYPRPFSEYQRVSGKP